MADVKDINMQALTYFSSGSDTLSTTINNLNTNTCYILWCVDPQSEELEIGHLLLMNYHHNHQSPQYQHHLHYFVSIIVLFINFYLNSLSKYHFMLMQ